MNRIASQFALLALAGTMLAASPTLAAPGSNGPDCRDPSQAKSPACSSMHKGPRGQGTPNGQTTPSGQNPLTSNMTGNGPPGPKGPSGPRPGFKGPSGPTPGFKGPPGPSGPPSGPMDHAHPAPGSMTPGHSGPPGGFDAFRRSFHFPTFAPPRFDVRPGISVPRDYGLRPLPPQIYAFYPMYRGYLFFVAPGGRIVIVSPRSLRIVAVL